MLTNNNKSIEIEAIETLVESYSLDDLFELLNLDPYEVMTDLYYRGMYDFPFEIQLEMDYE